MTMLKDKNQKNQTDENDHPDDRFFREVNVEFLIHELKDPMSVIETAVRTLLEKKEKFGDLNDRQEKILKRALKNSKKAGNMLHSLLEVGSSEAMCFNCRQFSPVVSVENALMNAIETEAGKTWEKINTHQGPEQGWDILRCYGINVCSTPGAKSARMLQDEVKFMQIAGNLVKNALYHMKGKLTINMDCREGFFILDVIDDGHGVEADEQELIFNRYKRAKQSMALSRKGHGLGLAGARIIARRLAGDITVKSKRGKGAAFMLKLPVTVE